MKSAQSSKSADSKMDPVVHFEFPGTDSKRMSKFYSQSFGWKTKQLGEENGNYVLVTTGEADKSGRPKEKGIINGGFFQKDESKPAQYPSVVIAVKNIKRAMKKIEKAGGKILGEPMKIPGYGMYVSFYDTEGNRVAIMEPDMD
jgi:predicted enzyme related to lactoylglutathione lyase